MAKKERDAVNRGMEEVLGGTDILGDVINRDRERFGRTEGESETPAQATKPTQYDNNTSGSVIPQYDTPVIPQQDTQTDKQSDSVPIPQTIRQPAKTDRQHSSRAVAQVSTSNLLKRVERAAQMATGSTTTITLRIPIQMNEWLDEYVHRAWPTKVKKQDLVIEALQMLIARRAAAGEIPIPTKLLLEDEEPQD